MEKINLTESNPSVKPSSSQWKPTLFNNLEGMLAGGTDQQPRNRSQNQSFPKLQKLQTVKVSPQKQEPINTENYTPPVPFQASPASTTSQMPPPTRSSSLFSSQLANSSKIVPQYLKNIQFQETHCKHGILWPIHVHIKCRIVEPNGGWFGSVALVGLHWSMNTRFISGAGHSESFPCLINVPYPCPSVFIPSDNQGRLN